MKTSALVHISSAHQGSFSLLNFSRMKTWAFKVPTVASLYVLSAVVASAGIGITANSVNAQTYYERPINTTNDSGYVATSTGIGLNIRSGPGLGYSIIGGAEDGVYLNATGAPVDADGYRWREITTGGWVATEYLTGTTDVAYDDPCYRPVSACGGTAQPVQPVQQPVIRPISTPAPVATAINGPYVVAVPGNDTRTIAQVRRFVPRAYVDRAREGNFVNAGGYSNYDSARALSHLLQSNGLDARVIYR